MLVSEVTDRVSINLFHIHLSSGIWCSDLQLKAEPSVKQALHQWRWCERKLYILKPDLSKHRLCLLYKVHSFDWDPGQVLCDILSLKLLPFVSQKTKPTKCIGIQITRCLPLTIKTKHYKMLYAFRLKKKSLYMQSKRFWIKQFWFLY